MLKCERGRLVRHHVPNVNYVGSFPTSRSADYRRILNLEGFEASWIYLRIDFHTMFIQWQNPSVPSWVCGFDSRTSHQFDCKNDTRGVSIMVVRKFSKLAA